MSSLVFPFHDPDSIESKLLKKVLPELKKNFESAFLSITSKTIANNPQAIKLLSSDNFFILNFNKDDSLIGDHFVAAYKSAVDQCEPNHILHLCTFDRICYALLSNFHNQFLADINKISIKNTPTLFVRSEKAWSTHPKNYQAAEMMVTEFGRVLFGKKLDFTWCHLSLTVNQLQRVLPKLSAHDMVIFAQLVMNLNGIKSKKVDWLSWEDPYIFDKNPIQLKMDREKSLEEFERRKKYTLSEIDYLIKTYQGTNKF